MKKVTIRSAALRLLASVAVLSLLVGCTSLSNFREFARIATIEIPEAPGTAGAANPYPSTITVSGMYPSTRDVAVTLLDVNHTWPDDIAVLLVGPTGQRVLLMDDVGGSADLFDVSITFDASAAGPLPLDSQITTGSYQPTNDPNGPDAIFPAPAPAGPHPSDLTVFDGTDPNGVWRLYVFDDIGGDTGFAAGWSITITAE